MQTEDTPTEPQFRITVSTYDTLQNMAAKACSHKLYDPRPEYLLFGMLKELVFMQKVNQEYRWVKGKTVHRRPKRILAMAWHENRPVGVLYIKGFVAQLYVKTPFRSKGLATDMLIAASRKYDLTSKLTLFPDHPGAYRVASKTGIGLEYTGVHKINNLYQLEPKALLE